MTWYVRCKSHSASLPCNWQLRATLRCTHNIWKIVTFVKEHTCVRVSNSNDHRQLSLELIAEYIIHYVQNGPLYAIKEIQTSIKRAFDTDVSYKKAWYARRRAIDIVYGDWPTSIAALPTYMQELVKANPGTVVEWKHHPQSSTGCIIFHYVFWAFGPVIESFRHLKLVICVDGTFMKGTYKAKLLVAVGFDASNRQWPLAFALVDEETNRSWTWFMSHLRRHVCREVENICVISDRHKGITHAMNTLPEWKEPLAVHRYYLIHVQRSQNFRNQRLKDLMWAAGAANQAKKYEAFMEQIWLLNEEAYKWLNGGSVKPEQ
nr:uncharacterized protein LOC113735939 [Coffea arabica]